MACHSLIAAVDDGSAQLDFLVKGLFPLLVGELLALYAVNTLAEVEHGDKGTGDVCRVGQ